MIINDLREKPEEIEKKKLGGPSPEKKNLEGLSSRKKIRDLLEKK